MGWQQILYVLLVIILIVVAIRLIRHNPTLFNKINFSKTVTTTGLITLLLIVVVWFCVILLRQH